MHIAIRGTLSLCTDLTLETLDVNSLGLISVLLDLSSHLKDVGKEEESALAIQEAMRMCQSLTEIQNLIWNDLVFSTVHDHC